ncbi:hypothetical protein GGR52DRAFT_571971 [Hypoxylon sp. FL1284]|nr:hypothetical protein GGR52DRAFT_571971 [Hypoxylon sp. FL1284]
MHSLANDSADSGDIAQLVVTALGSGGQHYICWKTHSGEYKQRSNGLPKTLQDWLFPADGSTRDFETLQVVLSGEDSFRASDRDGEVRSEPSFSQQRLRRALTISGDSPSSSTPGVSGRRPSRTRELHSSSSSSTWETERPRSSTLPAASAEDKQDSNYLPGPHAKMPATSLNTTHGRSSSADKLRRISLVSMAFHQPRRSWATRPHSFVGAEDLGVLKEQPSPRRAERPLAPTPATKPLPRLPAPAMATATATAATPKDHCTCGHRHENEKEKEDSKYRAQDRPKPNTAPRTGYADAGVQTDPPPDPEPEMTIDDFRPRRRRHHYRRESSESTASTAESSYRSSNSSKRSSFETTTTRPDSQCFSDSGWDKQQQQQQQPSNPVIMGRMQDYFRSNNYTLGAALQPQAVVQEPIIYAKFV